MNRTIAVTGLLVTGALFLALTGGAATVFPDDNIPYKRAGHWAESNTNVYVVVVVEPKYANERDLLALSRFLRMAHRFEQNVTVFIYDDLKSAETHVALLKNQDPKDFNRPHAIGRYRRYLKKNINDLVLRPNGPDGESLEIKYVPGNLPANHSLDRPAAR